MGHDETRPPIFNFPPHPNDRVLLEIDKADLPISASNLGLILSQHPDLFYRAGVIVHLQNDAQIGRKVIVEVKGPQLKNLAHQVCRPFYPKKQSDGSIVDNFVNLPTEVANLCMAQNNSNVFRHLDGITSTPVLRTCGAIRSHDGYDEETRLYCHNVPRVSLSESPTLTEAQAALAQIRSAFKTFAFEDSIRIQVPGSNVTVVDLNSPPGLDESSFLTGLMTSVCRSCFDTAPALLFSAPAFSGAGAGKGKLVRAVTWIAFGIQPRAIAAGPNVEELDKRLAAELISGGPVVFVDNVNNANLNSDMLASVITEKPAYIRILGLTKTVPLNSSAMIMVTGNGIRISGDLVRRFIEVKLNAGIENPESRAFGGDFDAEIVHNRIPLLEAVLTIWRWGILMGDALPAGMPLGSFTQWSRKVRDPLVALGCRDVVDRLAESRQKDSQRSATREFLETWWAFHGDAALAVKDVHEDVKHVLAPTGQSRQALASRLQGMDKMAMAGFTFTVVRPVGFWTPDKYQVTRDDGEAAPPRKIGPRPLSRDIYGSLGNQRGLPIEDDHDPTANDPEYLYACIRGEPQNAIDDDIDPTAETLERLADWLQSDYYSTHDADREDDAIDWLAEARLVKARRDKTDAAGQIDETGPPQAFEDR